jgi:hypothetical protein
VILAHGEVPPQLPQVPGDCPKFLQHDRKCAQRRRAFPQRRRKLAQRTNELGISQNTVRTHLTRLYRQLGVSGRVGVAVAVLSELLGSGIFNVLASSSTPAARASAPSSTHSLRTKQPSTGFAALLRLLHLVASVCTGAWALASAGATAILLPRIIKN